MWREEIELQADLSPSTWILPRLLPSILDRAEGTPVASLVPSGYRAYVRVLHPANIGGMEPRVGWRDVPARPVGLITGWFSTSRFVNLTMASIAGRSLTRGLVT
jgi:hypothetical protein